MSNSTPETSEKAVTSLSVSQDSAARSDSAGARSGPARRGSSVRSSAPRGGSRSAPRSSSGTGGSASAASAAEGRGQVKSRPRRIAPAKPVRVIRRSISAKMVMPPCEGEQAAVAATAAPAATAADSAAVPAAGDTASTASAGQLHRRKSTTSRAPDSVRRPGSAREASGKGRASTSRNSRRNQSRSEGQGKEAAENGQRPRSSRPSAPGHRRPAGKTGTSGAASGTTSRSPRRASDSDAAERSSESSTRRPSGRSQAPGRPGTAHPGKPSAAHPGKPGGKRRPDGQHSAESHEQKAKTGKPAPVKSRTNNVADAIKAARSRLRCMPAKYYFDRKGHVSQEMLFDPDSEGFNKLPSQVQLRSFSQLIKEKKAILAQHGIVFDQSKPKAVAANTAAAVVADAMEAADTAPAGASVTEQSDTGTDAAINTLISGGTVALAQDSSVSAVSDSNSAVGSSGGQVTADNNADQE